MRGGQASDAAGTAATAMVVTDLDGTLLDSRGSLGAANRSALERLGECGVLRVIATGRSLHSARLVVDADFPIDYLVFSSGVGIVRWPGDEPLVNHRMHAGEVHAAVAVLRARELDFMLHLGVPRNHHFYFHRTGAANADFERRCGRYRDFAEPLPERLPDDIVASQLLAIEPPGVESRYRELVRVLAGVNVVLTTSPLDHRSRWIEIFPAHVSKSRASEWLRARHGVAREAVVAVGNDHNDIDLLEWAGPDRAYVVANAAVELRSRFRLVASNDDQGFAEAVGHLMR